MKTRLLFLAASLFLTSCDILIIEPVYDARDQVIGSYKVDEYSQTYNERVGFYVYIRKSGGNYSDNVVIENFYNANVDVRAEIVGDKIYISRQVVNGYEIEGVGTIYFDLIRFNYSVKDLYYNRPVDFCEAKAWFV
ncbi:MAG: hypothetical protein JNM78_03745 [Cyclobacteriaceae bacterium]|nr:hypothetical protein [Cyclobacteriaceae bacterium]